MNDKVNLDDCRVDTMAKKKEAHVEKHKQSCIGKIENGFRKVIGNYLVDKIIEFIDYGINKPNPMV